MHSPSISVLFIILLIFYHLKCEARDIINAGSPLTSSEDTLVSAGSRFELGFFTPNDHMRYVGIWYYKSDPRTVVWVANRDNPVPDSCEHFRIAGDGNLKISCSNGTDISVTDLKKSTALNSTLQLLDSGNLILFHGGTYLWESFDYPTHILLPGMKIDGDKKLTSWISPNDPGSGDYVFHGDRGVYTIVNGSNIYWKSGEIGPLGTFLYNELPTFVAQILSDTQSNRIGRSSTYSKNNFTYINPNILPNFTDNYNNSRLMMDSSGMVQYYFNSYLVWSVPQDGCDLYQACGKFAMCYINEPDYCQCLPGFKPVSEENWNAGNYADGCDREIKICNDQQVRPNFRNLKLAKIKGELIPFDRAQEESTCKKECLNDCKCEAYMFNEDNITKSGTGNSITKCQLWKSDLLNLQNTNNDNGINISFRVTLPSTGWQPQVEPNSDCYEKGNGSSVNCSRASGRSKNTSWTIFVIVFTVLLVGVMLVSGSSYVLYQRNRMAEGSENEESTQANQRILTYQHERQVNQMMHEKDKGIDVPFYTFDTILSATDNFSDANRLGRGGFGDVYKATFPGGREIAVKRLSSCSGQGIDEFLNEVVLIAKLQHRNLVRLLGYCIKDTEKILLYEYMPNRSLDALIFDQNDCLLTYWNKRFDIILGIARGLLYLHQDSRLRIIHRDLKTSNILLDEEMNPKISDFGLARIIEGKQIQGTTSKVVGTFGYMSPEYALDGKFSVKSDVYSFGVMMLEIISGKKNTGFYHPLEVMTLLGHAWRLWSENKALELVDPRLSESWDKSQVMTCINIGLLCVQEDPDDRPSMSTAVTMLGSERITLPTPTQPAFVTKRRISTASSSSTKPDTFSNNELTISMAEGR